MKTKTIEWLLEAADIGVRYLALRDLVEHQDRELLAVKKEAHTGADSRVLVINKRRRVLDSAGSRICSQIHRNDMDAILLVN
jgi:hypothetical protein